MSQVQVLVSVSRSLNSIRDVEYLTRLRNSGFCHFGVVNVGLAVLSTEPISLWAIDKSRITTIHDKLNDGECAQITVDGGKPALLYRYYIP